MVSDWDSKLAKVIGESRWNAIHEYDNNLSIQCID
jgi:hypothetical protein